MNTLHNFKETKDKLNPILSASMRHFYFVPIRFKGLYPILYSADRPLQGEVHPHWQYPYDL